MTHDIASISPKVRLIDSVSVVTVICFQVGGKNGVKNYISMSSMGHYFVKRLPFIESLFALILHVNSNIQYRQKASTM